MRPNIWGILLIIIAHSLSASAQTESEHDVLLNDATVKARRTTKSVKSGINGQILWNMSQMEQLPKILGNSDPIHYAQMLPGIQTNNEYRGGINVHGCDNAHNFISIANVPVYNVNHLLGFFSSFVGTHYPYMSLSKTATSAAAASRLGATLNMDASPCDTLPPKHLQGDLSVGFISSQGTIQAKITPKTEIVVSGRGSYINLIYNSLLSTKDASIRYFFGDANLTLHHQIDNANRIKLDAYYGQDAAKMTHDKNVGNVRSSWGNNLQNLKWEHSGTHGWLVESNIYHTQYRNTAHIDYDANIVTMPSGISTFGARNTSQWKNLTIGADIMYHYVQKQIPYIKSELIGRPHEFQHQHALESDIFADWKQPLPHNFAICTGLRGSLFTLIKDPASRPTTFTALDPSLGITYERQNWQIAASWALRHQYLAQTGVSDMGLPTNFWIASSRERRPQYAHGIELSASTWLWKHQLQLTGEVFAQKLYHQLEYSGVLMDLTTATYDFNNMLLHGKGANWGANIMLTKPSGKVNGWLSYSYTRARRSFTDPGYPGTSPANHERPHELNTVVCYTPTKHWSISGTFVCASGTPFTAPKSFYILGNSIISQYAPHNSSRLKPYIRLDLSGSYIWHSKKTREQSINLSIYNATARANEIFYYISVQETSFSYRPISFFTKILPSLSYNIKF